MRLVAKRYYFIVASLAAFLVPSVAGSALTLTQSVSPSFGLIRSGSTGRQFVLNTDGSISGTHAVEYINGAEAGRFILEDTSNPSGIIIAVTVLGTSGGLTLNEALCSYAGGAQQVCGGSGMTAISFATATLLLGLDLTTTATHSGGDIASVSVEVSVSYL